MQDTLISDLKFVLVAPAAEHAKRADGVTWDTPRADGVTWDTPRADGVTW
jgi:hypothetical protein